MSSILNENERTKLINLGHLETYTEEIKDYIDAHKSASAEQLLDIQKLINTETIERKAADENLTTSVNNEILRATQSEGSLELLITNTKSNLETSFTSALQVEESNRNVAISNAEDRIDTKLNSQRSDINTQIATVETTIKNDYTSRINTINDSLNTEIINRTATTNQIVADLLVEVNKRAEEDAALRESIEDHLAGFRLDGELLTTHTNSVDNPHSITIKQIGAASQEEFLATKNNVAEIDTRLGLVEVNSNNNTTAISSLVEGTLGLQATKVNLNSELPQYINSDINIGKNLQVNGNLDILSSLSVDGNLIVKGSTTTRDQETITVKDNFIVLNSDNIPLGKSLVGLAIRTGADSSATYGIAYDKSAQSVSLGEGSYTATGDFTFFEGESNPILTRAQADTEDLKDGAVLVWDNTKKIAIAKEVITTELLNKTFTAQDDFNELQNSVTTLNDNLIELSKTAQEEIKPAIEALQVKDEGLEAALDAEISARELAVNNLSSTITGVYNEVTAHSINLNNPHQVKWSHIQEDALAQNLPKAPESSSFLGKSIRVAREDHVHPIDITRAPTVHTFTGLAEDTDYGKATTALYGHVKFDTDFDSGKDGVVSTSVIKGYVENKLKALNFAPVALLPTQTISKISETEGLLQVETQPIKIERSQVNGLNSILDSINTKLVLPAGYTSVAEIYTTLNNEDIRQNSALNTLNTILAGLTAEINSLKSEYQAADTALAKVLRDEIANTKADLLAKITSDEGIL